MATVTVTSTAQTLSTAGAEQLGVRNTGSAEVFINSHRLRPGQFRTFSAEETLSAQTGIGTTTTLETTVSERPTSVGGIGFGASKGVLERAGAGVTATLRRGLRSTCLMILGDSTGDATDEWLAELGLALGARYPTYSVLWRKWADSTQEYAIPTVLQAGTSSDAAFVGDRRVVLNVGRLYFTVGNTITGDVDLRADVNPTGGWAPGGAATKRTILSKWGSAGNRSFALFVDEAGLLGFYWSADGTATVATVVSTAAVPHTGRGWVRVTFDVDNGASGNTATFYTSTDGITWTALGDAVVTATATSLSAAASASYQIGGHGSTATETFSGSVYWTEIRSAIGGHSVVPPLPDDWEQDTTTTSATVTYQGAPVIMLVCGSQSGQNIAYLNDSTRRIKLCVPQGQQVIFLNTSHNEGNLSASAWISSYSAWVTDLKARIVAPIVCLAQNPTIPQPATGSTVTRGQYEIRAQRGAKLMAWAASQGGVFPLDVWPVFTNPTAQVNADGVHPVSAGSQAWAHHLYRQLFP